jgi:hypothetical protein
MPPVGRKRKGAREKRNREEKEKRDFPRTYAQI